MKRTNKLLSLLLALVLCLSLVGGFGSTTLAVTQIEGDFEFEVANGAATITGYNGTTADLTIPETLGGFPVKSIGERAFYYSPYITNVTIGNGVEVIGKEAFLFCHMLVNLYVGSDNPNYKSLNGVLFTKDGTELLRYPAKQPATAYTIPDGVIKIGDRAFDNCTYLKSVVFPDSVVNIGSHAFNTCKFTALEIGSNVERIADYAFYNCFLLTSVDISDSVLTIGEYAFARCEALTSIVIPDDVKIIANNTFEECRKLESVKIGSSVESIDERAFNDCWNLKNVSISNSVKSIGVEAFYECVSLTDLIIPNGVETIEKQAFYDCSKLTDVTIPSSVTTIGEGPFAWCESLADIDVVSSNPNYKSVNGVLFSKDGKKLIQYPIGRSAEDYTIPSSVESIGYRAFGGCDSLNSVILPDSVESIGGSAFSWCIYLKIAELGKNIESIETYAFYNCDDLTSVVIPNKVISIGENAFAHCETLTSAVIPNSVESIGNDAFKESPVTFYCNIYSYAELYARNRNIPVIHTWDMPAELDWANTGYTANYGEVSATGTLSMVARYSFAEGVNAEDVSLFFTIPDDAELVAGSLTLNNSPIDDELVNIAEGEVTITLTENQGVIRFLLRPLKYDEVYSYAMLNFTLEGEEKSYMLGSVNLALPTLTLEVQDTVGETELAVSGISIPGKTITLYIGTVEQMQVVANMAGDYHATLQLPEPTDGRIYTIRARTTDSNNNTITRESYVTYKNDAPNIEAFDMNYNGNIYKLFEMGSNKPIVPFSSGVRFGFTAKFDKTENISKVKVTSDRRGVVKELETSWNEALGAYTVKGFFDNYNPNYVPGVLTLVCTYTIGNSSHTLEYSATVMWAIDPSGYVYDNVSNERIEGVKATLYYKEIEDDEPTLWDATEYSQQNPLYTDADGTYAWDVPEGLWQVKYEHEDYQMAYSDWLPVPPPQTEVNIGMTPIRSVSKIEIETLPNKLTYMQNTEDLNTSGGMIKVSYSDASTKSIPLTEEMIEGFDNSQVGTKTLTVCYMGKTVDYTVSIESPILFGDANKSGSVDAADASQILRWVVKLVGDAEIDLKAANVTGSTTVSSADASKILRWIVRLIPTLSLD